MATLINMRYVAFFSHGSHRKGTRTKRIITAMEQNSKELVTLRIHSIEITNSGRLTTQQKAAKGEG